MQQCPKVTVLLPVYNGQRYIKQAIDSILAQTFKNFELLIINDGSTDDSVKIIKSYSDSRIRLVNNRANEKLIKTLNKGIELAWGQYIVRMDCDDISMPDRIAKQVSFMDAHPEVSVLGTSFQVIDSKGNRSYKVLFPLSHNYIRWSLCFYCPICHPSVIVRKDTLINVGGYSVEMLHAEDYELWHRISRKAKLANLPDTLLYLRKHQDSVCSTNTLMHNMNYIKINHAIVSEVLGDDIDIYRIRCIRDKTFRSWKDQFYSAELIERIRRKFIFAEILSPEEKRFINIDAAKRLAIIAFLRIFDLRSMFILFLAFHLDKLFLFRLLKILFLRSIPPIISKILRKKIN